MHLPRRPRAVNLSSIFMVPMVHGCAWVRDVYVGNGVPMKKQPGRIPDISELLSWFSHPLCRLSTRSDFHTHIHTHSATEEPLVEKL
jgi:hypothetical protein